MLISFAVPAAQHTLAPEPLTHQPNGDAMTRSELDNGDPTRSYHVLTSIFAFALTRTAAAQVPMRFCSQHRSIVAQNLLLHMARRRSRRRVSVRLSRKVSRSLRWPAGFQRPDLKAQVRPDVQIPDLSRGKIVVSCLKQIRRHHHSRSRSPCYR